ncbi:glycosyltransferase family 4 protein [Enterococcus faecium]|uniref:glycosyltransferase family 4 protein n=1 Tax=Enterococcus TaxID=1350 RepID=UPI00143322D0|nr:glycosyltransferase family 4 protein [Enterococcus faecium]EGP4801508.1 glycosyltransferase family 4 protein [Enterococcus faecium]EGP4956811.1 glycosyltransferase family 4 protein [Enterococcus faecium]EGP5197734.1 glycosyltransferase family 1 protein [Enterococcus faecium]EGP5366315.1 glycosyltransferase family 1 protein [Enterococcus faecium]EGP5491601.1 glycosyltransferase family 1 protein [Enterococcus faecium]
MKKILFLVNHDVVIYNFRLELVERLLHEGYEVWISSPYGERIDELKNLGCHYVEANISRHGMNPITELRLLSYYENIIEKINPAIVFTYTIKPNIYGAMACKKLHIPCVANITGLGTAVEKGGISQKISVLLYKLAFTDIQRVYFQNEENHQFFIDKKIALGKDDMLPGSGVNLERFALIDYPSDNTIEFAFIARIMKEKGIDNYLEAARKIKKKYPNTVFHVCGFCESEYDGKLQEYVDDGSVIYHGMVSNVRKIHEKVHCIVHPTYYPEGLSNVLLEACASGRPIITTDRSGCREVIEEGKNGFIVKQQDTQDLVRVIEKFILIPHEKKVEMGLVGRKKVEEEFNRQIVVEKYMNEVNEI